MSASRKFRRADSRSDKQPRPNAAESPGPLSHAAPAIQARARVFVPVALAAIALAGLLCYCNTFHAPFVMDDEGSIVYNAAIRNVANLRAVWNFSATRFVTYLSLALSYHFSKLNPAGYHVANLAIHVVVAWLVFFLVRLLFQTPGAQRRLSRPGAKPRPQDPAAHGWLALFAALLFVSHPVQTQAVTYVVQRTASLVALFYVLAMVLYVKFRLAGLSRSARGSSAGSALPVLWFAGSLAATVLAMLTKQNALTLPVAIVMIEIFFFAQGRRDLVKAIPWLIPFVLTFAVIPAAMLHDKKMNLGEISELAYETRTLSRSAYLLTQFNAIRTYLRLLVFPVRQNFDYDYPVSRSLLEAPTLLSFLLLAALFAAALFLYRRNRMASFGILFFFLALSVESSVIPIADVIFEHRVYLPCVGFFVALAALLSAAIPFAPAARGRVPSSRPRRASLVFFVVAAGLIAALCLATVRRNSVYLSKRLLWYDTAEKSPAKARPVLNLGAAYQEQGRKSAALELYRRAADLKPNYVQALANIAGLLAERGDLDEAGEKAQAALKINPNFAVAHLNMGVILAARGRYDDACRHFERAATLRSGYQQALFNWGYARLLQGKHEEAIRLFGESLKVAPGDAETHLDLGLALARTGRISPAKIHLQKALEIKPDLDEARKALNDLSAGRLP